MDYSNINNQSTLFGATTLLGSTVNTAPTQLDKNKEKKFNDWHQKQGLQAPNDYSSFAAQPVPFSTVRENPNQPTAASPFLQKVLNQQSANQLGGNDEQMQDADYPRAKPALKRTTSHSPPLSGGWPKSMFGTRPPSRTRARTSTPDVNSDFASNEENAPPLASIYDSHFTPAPPAPVEPTETPMTPTAVRVANFSEDRFPDLIRALRRYYGPILEPYSGLPLSESRYRDPEIIPRDQLDHKTAKMVQPMSGSEGGPGPWVRITFRDREAAERAVEGSSRGELSVGGRRIVVTYWEADPVKEVLPFAMEVDAPAMPVKQTPRRMSVVRPPPEELPQDAVLSTHLPGARLLVPKQVEFAKKDGWLGGWFAGVPSVMVASSKPAAQSDSWLGSVGRGYRYVMDELVGFKYL